MKKCMETGDESFKSVSRKRLEGMADAMFVLVTGANGQLGSDVLGLLKARGIPARGYDRPKLDITDVNGVEKLLAVENPTHVIHCAAYTAVDKAESERELCRHVNVDGTENVARSCKNMNAVMLYLSTDYVFDGTGEKEWTEEDTPVPLNWYGQSKLNGENAVKKHLERYFIVRTSWVFGSNGGNFVKTMLRLGREKPEISVVCDQVGSPTYTRDLAVVLVEMLYSQAYGTYHVTNSGFCSWYDFTREIFRLSGIPASVKPVTTEDYRAVGQSPAQALRPLNSRMSKKKLEESGFPLPYSWEDALARFLLEIDELRAEGPLP